MITNVMMKTSLNQKIIKISNFIQAMKSSVCPKPKVIRRLNFSESRICPNIYRMFPSVDWTHGMIIVKWREETLMIFPKAEFVRICPKIYRMFRSVDWTHDMIIVKWHLFIWQVRKVCALTCDPTVQSTEAGPWLKICLDQKIIKISNLIQAFKSSVCPKAKFIRKPNFSESRICPNIYRMFRRVDWTHDMIIVKWHLFIWHERKLCALTNAPPVQSTQTGQWLSTLFHAYCSAAQGYVLHSGQFIFALSCRRWSFLQVLQSTERKERYFENFFVYLMMTNVMVKTWIEQKIIKNSNLIQAMKNSVCPTANVIRRPIFPQFPNCGFNKRHDNREVTLIEFYESRICPNIYRIFTECSEVWIEHTTW